MTTIAAGTPASRVELTVRGVLLGALITLVFTAANVYLGLKFGLTVATSIPAAIISMGLLRAFKDSTIWENNIVQTVASAAGAMASVIFVLPGLVMVGAWTGFPFWTTFLLCALGGVMGVMYTVPLRRALVTQSNLPYPEGVAAAEVLKVGSSARGDTPEAAVDAGRGLAAIVLGSASAAVCALLTATRVLAGEISTFFRVGAGGATGIGASLSLALIGAGHLMGIAVGIAMLAGLIIAWGVAVPILTSMHPDLAVSAADAAQAIWTSKVRFIGAGAIGVSAIWALLKLVAPVTQGIAGALAAQSRRVAGRGHELERAERDIPIGIVAGVSALCLVPMGFVIAHFLQAGELASLTAPLVIAALAYIAVAGFAVAGVCGYMAGLIGSSNSPVSGLAILAVVGASLIVAAIGGGLALGDPKPLVAFALLVTTVLMAVAVGANDNLQDLKTGQLVDATPWRQQAALVVGVIAGSAVIPPILELLNRSNGFAGATIGIAADPLPAPQATLISTIAKGVVGGQLDWGLIAVGAAIGAVLCIVDETLRRTRRFSLPPLGVGMAIYLPPTLTLPIVIGSVLGWIYDRRVGRRPDGEAAKRLGVLIVSGFIVGESLFNVALSGLIVATNSGAPLALVPEDFKAAPALALLTYGAVIAVLYAWAGRRRA